MASTVAWFGLVRGSGWEHFVVGMIAIPVVTALSSILAGILSRND